MCASQIRVMVECLDPEMHQETYVSVPVAQRQTISNVIAENISIMPYKTLRNEGFTSAILLAT